MPARTLAGAAAGFLMSAAFGITAASAQMKIDMVAFGGASNLPIWVAMDKGLFAKEGLDLTLGQTRGSQALYQDIMAGKYQVGSAAIDNTVAYVEGQGDVKIDNFDMIAFLGVHGGLNTAIARPEIKSYADVKGKGVAVDAANSGYALVLYRILDQNGLKMNKDYQIVAVGGSGERMQAMKDNKAVIALLSSPTDLEAKALGYTFLGDAAASLGAYQGSAYVVRRSWAKDHEKELIALIRGIVNAHDYIFTDKAGAIEVMQKRVKGLGKTEAEALYANMTEGRGGLNRKAEINVEGVKTVLSLRSEYGQPKVTLTDPNKYIDTSYYEKAIKGMK
jgi:ABC-type nitrate/sulfonate/bicarbonate transport system substrate-binding protein